MAKGHEREQNIFASLVWLVVIGIVALVVLFVFLKRSQKTPKTQPAQTGSVHVLLREA